MKPTPAQQEAFDACMVAARELQAGLDPTPQQLARIRRAINQLRREPQPPGLIDDLEAGLGWFLPQLKDEP